MLKGDDSKSHTNTTQHREDNQEKWCLAAKQELVITSRHHLMKRYHEILALVRKQAALSSFTIDAAKLNRMRNDIEQCILSWKGVNLRLCQKEKQTFKQYKRTSTNWYNRNKPKMFGTYFFYPLVFEHIFSQCMHVQSASVQTRNQRMVLFIDILIALFQAEIKFANTKSWSLVPTATLMQHNRFKTECNRLLQHYQIEWNSNEVSPGKKFQKYQRDKCRSKKIFDSFTRCLLMIKAKLNSDQVFAIYGAPHMEHNSSAIKCELQRNHNLNENQPLPPSTSSTSTSTSTTSSVSAPSVRPPCMQLSSDEDSNGNTAPAADVKLDPEESENSLFTQQIRALFEQFMSQSSAPLNHLSDNNGIGMCPVSNISVSNIPFVATQNSLPCVPQPVLPAAPALGSTHLTNVARPVAMNASELDVMSQNNTSHGQPVKPVAIRYQLLFYGPNQMQILNQHVVRQ